MDSESVYYFHSLICPEEKFKNEYVSRRIKQEAKNSNQRISFSRWNATNWEKSKWREYYSFFFCVMGAKDFLFAYDQPFLNAFLRNPGFRLSFKQRTFELISKQNKLCLIVSHIVNKHKEKDEEFISYLAINFCYLTIQRTNRILMVRYSSLLNALHYPAVSHI